MPNVCPSWAGRIDFSFPWFGINFKYGNKNSLLMQGFSIQEGLNFCDPSFFSQLFGCLGFKI